MPPPVGAECLLNDRPIHQGNDQFRDLALSAIEKVHHEADICVNVRTHGRSMRYHFAARRADGEGPSPIFGVTIPDGYRQWELIAPSREPEPLNELVPARKCNCGKAYRDGALPFPDAAILAKLAWKHIPSVEFPAAFVPGAATTVQIMVKDFKKYTTTGGWGFGRFLDGKPVDEAQHKTCFPCP